MYIFYKFKYSSKKLKDKFLHFFVTRFLKWTLLQCIISGSPKNTCAKDKYNIKSFLQGLSKLLICGGYPGIDTCEVANLASSALTCKNPPNLPATVYQAIGGLGFKGNPIICGGLQNDRSNKCYSLENNEWVSSASMNSVRVAAAAAQLKDGKLLVTGGYASHVLSSKIILEDNTVSLNSAEMLTEEE